MRKRISALLTVAAVAAFAVTGVACQGKKSEGYYLSMLDNGVWTEYKKEKDIPDEYKMTKTDDGLYGVTVTLGEGANLKVAQIGNKEKYGYTELFSSLKYITEGDDNALVAKAGEYEITFDASEKLISYTYKSKDPSGGGNQGTEADVAVVEITGDSTRALAFANATAPTLQLEAVATKDDATTTSEGITWTSSEPTVATVSESGLVTAVTAGTTQITASLGGVTSEPVTVNVEGLVTLSDSAISLTVDGTKKITPTLIGGATASGANPWSVVNTDVATVASDGTVTGVAAGTTTLRYEYLKRPGVTPTFAECSVTVATPVEGISVASELTVPQGETVDLAVGFIPADASNKNFTYEVKTGSDKITVVKEGSALKVTGNSTGEATIEVTSVDGGFKKTCTVTVAEAGAKYANISTSSLVMNKGGTGSLTVSGSGISSVSWSATGSGKIVTVAAGSDTKAATVTATGFGKATVTATVAMEGGSSVTKTCEVIVTPNQMWLYGDIVTGGDGWALTETVSGAQAYDLVLEKTETGVFTGEIHLPANKDFRIAHDSFDYKGIRYEHLSTVANERQYVSQGGNDQNGNYNVKVQYAGVYAITVDLTGGTPSLKITNVSVDVTDVALTPDKTMITSSDAQSNTAVIDLTINPDGYATYEESDIVWTLTNESLVDKSITNNGKTITITAKDGLQTGGTVRVTVTVKGKTAYRDISVLKVGGDITAATSVNFDSDKYTFNVNGTGGWTGTVHAEPDSAATIREVEYSKETADTGISINASTGEITATKVGTYKITATATDGSGRQDFTYVTFYSDMFYITGDANGWGFLASSVKTTVGSTYEHYTFTATSDEAGTNKRKFELKNIALAENSTFAIMFCGAKDWDSAYIGGSNAGGILSTSGNNVKVTEDGVYTFTLDISGTTPALTATKTALPVFTASLMSGETAAFTSGESSFLGYKYVMTFAEQTYQANAVYALRLNEGSNVVNTTATDFSLTGNADDMACFSLSSGTLTCVTEGKYRLTFTYDTLADTCSIKIESIDDAWESNSTYSVEAYGDGGTIVSSACQYNSSTQQYKLTFSYSANSGEWFKFGIKDTAWRKNVDTSTAWEEVSDITFTKNTDKITAATGEWASDKYVSNGANVFTFEVVFTASGTKITFISVTVS